MPIPFLIGGVVAAVSGAATVVGGAAVAAGTAIGAAAVGTAATVGGGVAAVAAAASSAPIIGAAAGTVAAVANTTAGAAALGTVAATGAVGVVNGASGAKRISEAKEVKESALELYNSEKRKFDRMQTETNNALKKLGEEKLKIWASFERFSTMYSKIQNPPVMDGEIKDDTLPALSIDDLQNIKAVAITAKEMLKGGVTALAAGELVGVATSAGLVGTITAASTGASMATLSGAAATNATLAAFGGGSLAAGGAGMAGGAAVLGGLTFAPMIMVGGIMLNGKSKEALSNAKDIKKEVEDAVENMQAAKTELSKVKKLSKNILNELITLNDLYSNYMIYMESVISKKTDYRKFTLEEKKMLEKTILSLKLIKYLSMQNILDDTKNNKVLTDDVTNAIQYTSSMRNTKLT